MKEILLRIFPDHSRDGNHRQIMGFGQPGDFYRNFAVGCLPVNTTFSRDDQIGDANRSVDPQVFCIDLIAWAKARIEKRVEPSY